MSSIISTHSITNEKVNNNYESHIELYGNLMLPYTIIEPNDNTFNCDSESVLNKNNYGLIFGHGLGASNPKNRSHQSDEWGYFISSIASSLNMTSLLYTARGHGSSSGWEDTSESNPEQFTWEHLSKDMNELSILIPAFNRYIATGSSMGSATALYASILYPDNVKAVIMIRPPTAWKERQNRKRFLIGSAEKLKAKEKQTGSLYHSVLFGTASSDIPSLDSELYSRIKCPYLILTITGDDAHPLSTAEALHRIIPQSQLNIATSKEEAISEWPSVIRRFLSSIVD